MTKDEALKMAIEALEDFSTQYARLEPIINACKAALEQPAWQGLTDDEIIDMYFQANISPQPHESIIGFIRAIEQALKEKNNG